MNRSLVISASLLLGANVVALVCAISFRWNLFEIVLLYWIQALIVGVFQRQKIKDMVTYARHPRRAKWFRAHGTSLMQEGLHNGFAGIYGVFWAGVTVTLLITFFKSDRLAVDVATVLSASSAFIFVHWWSYRSNKPTDEQRVIDINVLILPMARMLLPLHVFCVVMDLDITTNPTTTFTWMSIKTAADLGAHIVEHNQSRRIPST
jgi:hypothetical protein